MPAVFPSKPGSDAYFRQRAVSLAGMNGKKMAFHHDHMVDPISRSKLTQLQVQNGAVTTLADYMHPIRCRTNTGHASDFAGLQTTSGAMDFTHINKFYLMCRARPIQVLNDSASRHRIVGLADIYPLGNYLAIGFEGSQSTSKFSLMSDWTSLTSAQFAATAADPTQDDPSIFELWHDGSDGYIHAAINESDTVTLASSGNIPTGIVMPIFGIVDRLSGTTLDNICDVYECVWAFEYSR